MRVNYDRSVDVAYIYLRNIGLGELRESIPVEDDRAKGSIMLDFDEGGRLIGVDVFGARTGLSRLLDELDEMRVTYDRRADIAHVLLKNFEDGESRHQILVDTEDVAAAHEIILDLDAEGRLIGIKALGAQKGLPQELLDQAAEPRQT